ncbi:hypothetical protein EVY35_22340 [Serratia marcescens]|nr:hypothetical protein EVY35_22340 [Serratia marcescens]
MHRSFWYVCSRVVPENLLSPISYLLSPISYLLPPISCLYCTLWSSVRRTAWPGASRAIRN